MALTFPLALNEFIGPLRIRLAEMNPTSARIVSRTRGGEQIVAEVGNRLWRGTAQLTDYYHADADAIRAKLSVLEGASASFFVAPSWRDGPIADPTGGGLAGSSLVLHSAASNNRELRIGGLPQGYVISAGDYLSFTYGADPARYAFHHVVTGGVAAASGQTPLIEVTPHLRPGALPGAAVALVRPRFKAVLVQSPAYGSLRRLFTGGMGFEFIQTLGA